MPLLKMYLCNMLISQYKLDYTGMATPFEKEAYQIKIANEMYQENIKNINLVQQDPFFCIEVFSNFKHQ